MNTPIQTPSPIVAVLLFSACLALSACNRTDRPADEVSPAAREAASEADAIAVPPVPEASAPNAASQPQSSVSSADEAMPSPMAQTASAGTAATDTPPAAAAEVTLTADTAGDITAASAPAGGGASAAVGAGSVEGKLYQVVDGYKVDEATMEGFRTWRAAACDRCHGANQEGMVGPSLIESLKVRDKAYFVDVLTNGRLVKGMPSFNTNTLVMENLDELYAYLKGRSDGAITRAKVQPMS